LQPGGGYVGGGGPISVAIGELNGDGRSDLAVANVDENTVSVFLMTHSGRFADKVDYGVGESPFSLALGDLDQDGKLDLVTANYDRVTVLRGIGGGGFARTAN